MAYDDLQENNTELRAICADVFDWLHNGDTEHTELELVTRICAALGRPPEDARTYRDALVELLRDIIGDTEYVGANAPPRTIALSAGLINRAVTLYHELGLITDDDPTDYISPEAARANNI